MPAIQSVLNTCKSLSSYLLIAPRSLLPTFSQWVIYQLNFVLRHSGEPKAFPAPGTTQQPQECVPGILLTLR